MRQRRSEVIFLPGIRESVADKEILKIFLFFPFREVNFIPAVFANLLYDVKKIGLPRTTFAVGVPRKRTVIILGKILNIA